MDRRRIDEFNLDLICSGCGVCIYICPQNAIKLRLDEKKGEYRPLINDKKCLNCGRCIQVCPGIEKEDKVKGISNEGVSEDFCIGRFRSIYYGYAMDDEIRFNSSSGGIITALLIYMLRERIVDGVVVTKFFYGNKVEAKAFITTQEEEILESMGSKYCPVNMEEVFLQIKHFQGKLVIVCLPCVAKALRLAMRIDRELMKKVRYIFSLFCGRRPSYQALLRLFKNNHIEIPNIRGISFRGKGWPGKTTIFTFDKERSYEYLWVWKKYLSKEKFLPLSCYRCNDFFGEFSDVSFGDAWIPQCKEDTKGTSLVITRNKNVDNFISDLSNKILILNKITSEELKKSFFLNILEKKINYEIRKKILEVFYKFEAKKISKKDNFRFNIWNFFYEVIRFAEISLTKFLDSDKFFALRAVEHFLKKSKNFLINQQRKEWENCQSYL